MSWAVVRPAHVEMHHSRCHKKPGPTCGALNARSRPRPGTAAAPQPSGPLTVTKTPLTPGPAKTPRGGQVCGLDGMGSRLGAGTRSPISAWWRRAHSGIEGYGDVLCSISVCPAFCAVWLGVA